MKEHRTTRHAAVRGRRRIPRLKRLPPLSVMPTLLTLGNLLCGFAAIHYAARPIGLSPVLGWSTLTLAGCVIFLAMVCDALDGTMARLTRSTSDFGAQLDSLADVVSFGVAPAFMMLRLVSHYYGTADGAAGESGHGILGPDATSIYAKAIWSIAAVYVCCAALRLARFNVETPSPAEEDHRWFRGLPSPGAAGTVASLIVLHQHLLANFRGEQFQDWMRLSSLLIPLVTLLCAVGMVSRMRYAHMVNRFVRGRRPFGYVVWVAIFAVAAILIPQITLTVGFVIYALSGPINSLMRRIRPPVPAAVTGAGTVTGAAPSSAAAAGSSPSTGPSLPSKP